MKRESIPHLAMFPAPNQGHVNSMLKLAEVLYLSGLTHITFFVFSYIHEKLTQCSDTESRFASQYPGFKFAIFPDCMPMSDGPKDPASWIKETKGSMKKNSKPVLKKMLAESNPTVDVMIGDMTTGFIYDAAADVRIPCIQFQTISACCMWLLHSIPRIVAARQLPIRGEEDMDRLITVVPGMETILRCRDLPKKFCQVSDIEDPNLLLATNEMREAYSLILNTFEELEGPILSQIRTQYPKTYTIGPIHELLKEKLRTLNKQESYTGSHSMLRVDRSCLKWLDQQPLKSVLYVNFGSFTMVTIVQMMELWHGLINSKQRFLWIIRPKSLVDEEGNALEKIPIDFEVGPKEMGYVVSWAPQEEVLGHKAIGGFWTHSGWNSTLESIVVGVPMLCWPYFTYQQVNSRFVGEVWKLGLDMKDICDRKIVEKMVTDLMVNRKEEFTQAATKMAELAKISVTKDGSSSKNIDRLVKQIKLMSSKNSYST